MIFSFIVSPFYLLDDMGYHLPYSRHDAMSNLPIYDVF